MVFLWFVYVAFRRSFKYAVIPTVLILIIFFATPLKDEYIRKISLDYIEAYKEEASADLGFIAFDDLVITESISGLILSTPYTSIRFLLSPFPWNPSNLQYTFAYLDALFVFGFILLLIFRAYKRLIWDWNIVLFALIFIVAFGIFEIAFTGAARHRMPFIILLLPLLVDCSSTQAKALES